MEFLAYAELFLPISGLYSTKEMIFSHGSRALLGIGLLWVFLITVGHTTFGRIPPDERSARRRDLYTPDNAQHSQRTDLHLTTHKTHNGQTSTWQHTTLTTDRPLPDNTQHSQQTDLYLTTHNTHNRQTSIWQNITLTTDRPPPDNT